jgi:Domain of unknown function (DUF4157)
MTRQKLTQTDQQPKSETPLVSGILQRAAIRTVPENEVQPTDQVETSNFQESRFHHDFSQVPVHTSTSGKENKTVIENLSGYSIDDVRVHYNSDKSAQLQAHTYAPVTKSHTASSEQGTEPNLQAKGDSASADLSVRISNLGHSYANLMVFSPTRSVIQPKLIIGQPGDKYEQEANSMAAQVVQRINQPETVSSKQEETVQRQEVPEEEEVQMKPGIQGRSDSGAMPASERLESAISQARGGGQLLASSIRQPMEQAFDANFSSVRVHTDARADQLNRSINARAFTTKNDLFFKQGEYNPASRQGQELLAHELTHVVQQSGGNTIQRKQANLEPLKDEFVSKSSFLKLSNKTEKIQKKVKQYNEIPIDNTNYENQDKILSEIMEISRKWIYKHENLKGENPQKVEQIYQLRTEASFEKKRIEQQQILTNNPDKGGTTKGSEFTETMLGSRNLAITANIGEAGGAGYGLANAGATAVTEKGLSKQSFVLSAIEKVKGLFESGKDAAKDPGKAVATEAASIGVGDVLKALGLPLGMFGLAVRTFIIAKRDRAALLESKQALNQKLASDNIDDIENQLLQDVLYGYAKVKRRFYNSIYGLVNSGIDLVSTVLGLLIPGIGTAAMAAVALGKTVLNGFKTAFFKAKGIYKYVEGTRGKNRKESAKRVVSSAKQGHQESLKLLIGLLRDGDIKTPEQMLMHLEEKTSSSLEKFTNEVAEKLKSQ